MLAGENNKENVQSTVLPEELDLQIADRSQSLGFSEVKSALPEKVDNEEAVDLSNTNLPGEVLGKVGNGVTDSSSVELNSPEMDERNLKISEKIMLIEQYIKETEHGLNKQAIYKLAKLVQHLRS